MQPGPQPSPLLLHCSALPGHLAVVRCCSCGLPDAADGGAGAADDDAAADEDVDSDEWLIGGSQAGQSQLWLCLGLAALPAASGRLACMEEGAVNEACNAIECNLHPLATYSDTADYTLRAVRT